MVSSHDLFKMNCDFAAGAITPESLPAKTQLPEFPFIGRSNVGKSSLLNALVGRKSLARVSQNPGCTRQINFFNLGEKLFLVDLPGYGYARASKKEIEHWGKFMPDYLRGRRQIKRIFLLIDSRRGIQENDEQMMRILDDAAQTYQVLLTKTDKLSEGELEEVTGSVSAIIGQHVGAFPGLMRTSSETKDGIDNLKYVITSLL